MDNTHSDLRDAAKRGDVNCLQECLGKRGVDINAPGMFKVTALHEAALHNRVQCVQLLLSRKANPDLENGYGDTALYSAVINGHEACVKVCREEGTKMTVCRK